jgi:hypothetical protein
LPISRLFRQHRPIAVIEPMEIAECDAMEC